jgi:DNA-binding response OmpR family regulator
MTRRKILVVDDDVKTVELIRRYLERDGHQVLTAHDGRAALEAARQHRPDLIVLDLMLPGMDGLAVCRQLRAETQVPILMLTARTTEDDILLGLELGADDYVTKPFSPREVAARVLAILRRSEEAAAPPPAPIRRGPLRMDPRRHQAFLGEAELNLTPKEFRLLWLLAQEPGRVYSRPELVEQAFGLGYEGFDRTIDVHVLNLRKKLEADPANPRFIQTVFGIGYKFAEQDDVA